MLYLFSRNHLCTLYFKGGGILKVLTNNQFKYAIFKPNNNKNTEKTIFIYPGWGGSIDHYFNLAEKLV